MYENYWGFSVKPFLNTPDPRFLYYSGQHEEALSRLIYTVQERIGAGMLTGVFGCGKTLIAQTLLKELSGQKYKTAYITNPRLNDVDILRMIVHHLGIIQPPLGKADVLNNLHERLINNMRNGKETVIIIDEAHAIDDDNIFEEIRLLLNFQLEDRFLLTLLLLGQPELKQKIDKNVQLEQRINIKCYLGSLNTEETHNYIIHRLAVAKRTVPIFTEKAISSIFNYSGGIPRRINRICDICLLAGFVKRVDKIDDDIVQEEINGFD
ncbi:MAG: AAA family ATPase [Candidatus Omnitrophota bacterium]|nr:AAA family ATPase [Candidatus Omnitrophota bacterium]